MAFYWLWCLYYIIFDCCTPESKIEHCDCCKLPSQCIVRSSWLTASSASACHIHVPNPHWAEHQLWNIPGSPVLGPQLSMPTFLDSLTESRTLVLHSGPNSSPEPCRCPGVPAMGYNQHGQWVPCCLHILMHTPAVASKVGFLKLSSTSPGTL